MKSVIKLAGMALALAGSGMAIAATQGSLDAVSSTGSYTNTFGVTAPRRVQILQLSDAVITPASGQVYESGGAGMQRGIVDNFCVVDTQGAAVRLTFQGNFGPTFWNATSGTGGIYPYLLNVGRVGGSDMKRITAQAGQSTFDIPAGSTIVNPQACGAGNMQKLAVENGTPPATGSVFTSLVTVVATPI